MAADPIVEGLRIEQRLGAGAFATVYRAWDAVFDRFVAAKVLHMPFTDDAARRQFERECRSLGRLSDHPGIITVHRTAESETGQAVLVMAFAEDGTWDDRLKAGNRLDEAGLLREGAQLADALAAAHSRHVLHLDIKPANILVAYGRPMLADFGIAKLADRTTTMTVAKNMSAPFAPPEIYDEKPPTTASDVWSMAATLCTMVAGTPPFGDGSTGQIALMASIVLKDPLDMRTHGLSEPVWDVLRSCLEKDPKNRPADGAALRQALAGAVTTRQSTVHVPPRQPAWDPVATPDATAQVGGPDVPMAPTTVEEAPPGAPATALEAAPAAEPLTPDAPPKQQRPPVADSSPGQTWGSTSRRQARPDMFGGDIFESVFGVSASQGTIVGLIHDASGTRVSWKGRSGYTSTVLPTHFDAADIASIRRQITEETGEPPTHAIVGRPRSDEVVRVQAILDRLGLKLMRTLSLTTTLGCFVLLQRFVDGGDVVLVHAGLDEIEVALAAMNDGVLEMLSNGWLPVSSDLAADLPAGLRRSKGQTALVIAGPRAREVTRPRSGWRDIKVIGGPILADAACQYSRILTGHTKDALLLDSVGTAISIQTPNGPHPIVPSDDSIPLTRTEKLTTYEDGQTRIEATIMDGHPPVQMATISIDNLPPLPAGELLINLTVDIDANRVVVADLAVEGLPDLTKTVTWTAMTPALGTSA